MKPWTEKKQLGEALSNAHLAIGERETPLGRLRGVYAKRAFHKGDFVASFHGQLMTRQELFGLHGTNRPLFDFINEYAAMTRSGHHIYPVDKDACGAHLINHSCHPNAVWDRLERGALLVRAIRSISEGDELAIHYGWLGVRAAIEQSIHPCACGAPYCAGTIELRLEFIQNAAERTAGTKLPAEEVENRFLADIVNGSWAHEATLHDYGKNGMGMYGNAQILEGVDRTKFLTKLQAGALSAVEKAASLPAVDRGRLAEIANRYRGLEP